MRSSSNRKLRELYEAGILVFDTLQALPCNTSELCDGWPRIPADLPFNQVLQIDFFRFLLVLFRQQLAAAAESPLPLPSRLFQIAITAYLESSGQFQREIILGSGMIPLVRDFLVEHESYLIELADESTLMIADAATPASPTGTTRAHRYPERGLLEKTNFFSNKTVWTSFERDNSARENDLSEEDESSSHNAIRRRRGLWCCRHR